MAVALEVQSLSKRFGGLQAVHDVNLRISSRELRCIIGPNGAGKTTLFNLITGRIKRDCGYVVFEGVDITGLKPHEISRKGIIRKFQVPTVFEDLAVLDNLIIAAMGGSGFKSRAFFHREEQGTLDQVNEIMEVIHLCGRDHELAANLSHGEKQWLEIGMVLACRPQLMLLDEPTAGMSPQETMETSKIITRIAQDITTIVIEHDIKFLKQIGQNVTVMHQGSVLVEGTFDEIANLEQVRDVYLGRQR